MLELVVAPIGLTARETNFLVIGIVSLVAGVTILVYPRVLNYLVAAWLILAGVAGIVAAFS